jgi:hypothetical protein
VQRHLDGARQAARFLAVAICLNAEDNRPAEGMAKVRDGLAVAGSLDGELTSMAATCQGTVYYIVLGAGLERLLSRTTPSGDDLADVERRILDAAGRVTARDTFVAQIAEWTYRAQQMAEGKTGPEISYESDDNPPPSWFSLWMYAGLEKRQAAIEATGFLKMIEYASNTTPAVLQDAARGSMLSEVETAVWLSQEEHLVIYGIPLNSGGPVVAVCLPLCLKQLIDCEKHRAQLRATAACVAALRYRNDNAKWPETLDALVPKYIDAVPIDPFTGKALVYKVSKDGIMAYSVGPNLVDDEGRPSPIYPPRGADEKKWAKYDDVGFRIWK